ncbi:MAG: DUF2339 domain-containing protein [Deltaproteobacteria bacterium]|nr:DUF2339 domain-containing protein [Deltaproteobacteria bacterium]
MEGGVIFVLILVVLTAMAMTRFGDLKRELAQLRAELATATASWRELTQRFVALEATWAKGRSTTEAAASSPASATTDTIVPPVARATAEAQSMPTRTASVSPQPTRAAPPPRRPAPPPPAPPKGPLIDWEKFVGVKLFSWIAGVALVIAAIFFLSYSVEQGWLTPPIRTAVGFLVGIGLLGLSEFRFARRYATTANALDAGAIGVLFATCFAAHSLWSLLPSLPTLLLMALITATAVLLSLRRHSPFIAGLGLLSGFATPALLASGVNRPLSLFGYLLLLNVGLVFVAERKQWRWLTTLCLILTTGYQWGWAWKFLAASPLPLALGIFLIFPVVAVAARVAGRRWWQHGAAVFTQQTAVCAMLPVLFALYLAATPMYGARYGLFFGFLGCLAVGLGVVAWRIGPTWLHWVGGASTLGGCAIWLGVSYVPAAWPTVLGMLLGFTAFYAWLPRGAIIAALLGTCVAVLPAVDPAVGDSVAWWGAVAAWLLLVTWAAVRQADRAAYWVAGAVAYLALGIWSQWYGTVDHCATLLLAYVLTALYYIAVPAGVRRWRPAAVSVLQHTEYIGLASGLLLLRFVATEPVLTADPVPFLVTATVLLAAWALAALQSAGGALFAAALFVAFVSLLAWIKPLAGSPWPTVALLLGTGYAAFGCVVYRVAGRIAAHVPAADGSVAWSSYLLGAAGGCVLAQFAVASAALCPGAPPLWLFAGAELAAIILLLALAVWSRQQVLAVVAVASTAIATAVWKSAIEPAAGSYVAILTAYYLAFAVYPLLCGRVAGRALSPALASVAASGLYFLAVRRAVGELGWGAYIGVLPLAQAALLLVQLRMWLQLEPAAPRDNTRLALVAGAALAFLTVAIPLQLDKQWITIGWALQGAALALLYGRIPHRGLFWWGLGLLGAVFVRLVLNREVFAYYPRSAVPILNWYLYTYLLAAGSCFAASVAWRRTHDVVRGAVRGRALVAAAGAVLLFLLLNIEVADYYSSGATITFNFSGSIAQDLSYTLAWGCFAVALLAAGIMLRNRPTRLTALVLMTVTIFKGFLHDLWRLGGLYRVGTFVGLAVCLALVALALQRFVLVPKQRVSQQ